MGIASAQQNRITRTGGSSDEPASSMHISWYRRFLVLFGLLGLAVITGVWFDSGMEIRPQIIVTLTVIAMALWFWFYGQWHLINSDAHAIVYLLGNIVGITLCIRLWETSSLMLFAIYWFGFAYLYVKFAVIHALILTLATQWAFGSLASNLGFNLNTLVAAGSLTVLLGLSAMMARYIEAFQKEAELNKALVAELKLAQQSLLEREREAGIEQERHRVAGEIHDTVAQHFASIITNLRAAGESEERSPDIANKHRALAISAAQQGLTDSRAMLSTMQPDVLLGRSLVDVLQTITTEWSQYTSIPARFDADGAEGHIDRGQEAILVRALQESLRNIDKHANATEVTVTTTWLEDEMLMDITDNGNGFDPETIDAGARGYHMGIMTMRSRVESAGGTFALESAIGEGTSITIAFPSGGPL